MPLQFKILTSVLIMCAIINLLTQLAHRVVCFKDKRLVVITNVCRIR